MRRDQEGRQRQGLRVVFKQENGRITMYNIAEASERFSSDEEVIGAVKTLLKTQPKKTFF
jgi:hypothetical protein